MSPQSPGPAEMPQNKARSWSELKQAANACFKTGQYGEAVLIYSRAISQLERSSKCPEQHHLPPSTGDPRQVTPEPVCAPAGGALQRPCHLVKEPEA